MGLRVSSHASSSMRLTLLGNAYISMERLTVENANSVVYQV